MKRLVQKIFLILFVLLLLPKSSFADGSRMSVEITTNPTTVSAGTEVKTLVHQDSSPDSPLSIGEDVVFKIRNPRDGDHCDTRSGGTDVNGYGHGGCYATQPGTMTIYVHSNANGDDSSDATITFNAAPTATPTVTPTVIPTKIPIATQADEPAPTEVEESPTEIPTPTPKESQVLGFFARNRTLSIVLLFLIPIAILAAIAIMMQKKLWIFSDKKKPPKGLKKIETRDDTYPPENIASAKEKNEGEEPESQPQA